MVEVQDLNTTQLFIAGSILSRTADELSKSEMDKDTKKAVQYILNNIDIIEKEISEQILQSIREGFLRVKESIENE